ncbi:MAG: spore coat protein [Firmicutes bacterium]|nr:spore coat protein [Bacillota bacterium]
MLLQDQANHEKICIQKYNNYANQTQDPQLKQLLQAYAQEEEEHLNTLKQIMGGTVPNIQQKGQQQAPLGTQGKAQQQTQEQQTQQVEQKAQQDQQYSQQTQEQIEKAQQQTQQAQQQQLLQTQGQMGQQQVGSQAGLGGQKEKDLLTDLLMTEKYMSNTYDTAIFEFTNSQVRQVLNHIQKEEQEHGEGIFNYMQSHGMYNPQ